jgi:hypothetical protein
MVHTTNDKRKIMIELNNDIEELTHMQKVIIDLIRQQHTSNEPTQVYSPSIYYALELLEALLPTPEQQQQGFVRSGDYLELPENLPAKSRQALHSALYQIKHPESPLSSKPNPVLLALNSI